MSKIRVYQLAKELGLSNREVIECLVRAGVSVKSSKSSVDEAVARAALSKEQISKAKEDPLTDPPAEPERPHSSLPPPITLPHIEAPASRSAPPVVTIPEMITVKDLSEKLATSRGEIIKKLMKLRIAATANQNLSPELAKQVAVEFGVTVEVIPFEEVEEFVGAVGDSIQLAPVEPLLGVGPERTPLPGETNLPIPKIVKISEMVTVKELSEKVATSPGEIIKTLMKRGITATLNQNLALELARQVAVEFGAMVAVIPFEEAEQYRDASHVGLPDIPWLEPSTAIRGRGGALSGRHLPSATDGWTGSSYFPKHKGWLLTSAIAAMILLFLVVPREKETPSIEVTPAVVDGGQRNAAIPSIKVSSSPAGDARSYREDIKPLIAAYCDKCHAPKGVAAGIPLKTYRDVRQYVEPGRSEDSPLYTSIQERRNHVNPWPRSWGNTTNDNLAVIKDWIDVSRAAE